MIGVRCIHKDQIQDDIPECGTPNRKRAIHEPPLSGLSGSEGLAYTPPPTLMVIGIAIANAMPTSSKMPTPNTTAFARLFRRPKGFQRFFFLFIFARRLSSCWLGHMAQSFVRSTLILGDVLMGHWDSISFW